MATILSMIPRQLAIRDGEYDMKVTILTEGEIRECVNLNVDVIDEIENAFSSIALGNATVPPILVLEIPEARGETDVKAAHIHGLESFGIKIASGFYDNPRIGLPSVSGVFVVLSAKTGMPEAVLIDNSGYLSNVRTAAAGGVAARHLAPQQIRTAGVIGAGAQARVQIMALSLVRSFDRLMVFSIEPDEIAAYKEDMQSVLGVEVVAADDVETVVRSSDVVVTTTPARKPYLKAEWLHPGLHITSMGSDMEEKQELEANVLSRADVLACDQKSQCFRLGELHHGLTEGTISEDDDILELGELAAGLKVGRKSEEDITICDLVGIGVQDSAISIYTVRKALEKGLGLSIEG
jgi:ornithine cyclodeaminase